MTKNKMVLLKNFAIALPESLTVKLLESVPEAFAHTVKNVLEFNRWELSVRTDEKVVSCIQKLQETDPNLVNMYFKIVEVTDIHTGVIQIDSNTNEELWQSW